MFRAVLLGVILTMSAAMEVTHETWKDLSVDKTLFVRFVGPSCPYCARMKADFDKLRDEFKDSDIVSVVEIDCGGSSKQFCTDMGVLDFPRIKYGHLGHLEEYVGSQTVYELRRFVKTLRRACNADTLEGCHEHQRREIRRLSRMTDAELQTFVDDIRARTSALEVELSVEKKRLNHEYNRIVKEHEDAIAELREEGDFAMHKIMLHHRTQEL